jgi:enamine deaminase RidA (YjgF/YER057c/UK114 family)
MLERINPETVAKPIGTYDHVVKIPCKTLLFVAGQISIDQQGKMVGQDPSRQLNLEAQLRQTYANIKACLNAAGADFKDVVRMNTYVVASAMNEYRNLNIRKVKEEMMGGTYGAGTVVFVAGLMRPDSLVEIEVIAALDH